MLLVYIKKGQKKLANFNQFVVHHYTTEEEEVIGPTALALVVKLVLKTTIYAYINIIYYIESNVHKYGE